MNEGLLFGYTEAQIAQFGLTFGVGAFILYMMFIVFNLAREAKAGRFGTFVLFLVLTFGMVGFLAKSLIQWIIGI
jgi:predicted Kef-type K+ transport protein